MWIKAETKEKNEEVMKSNNIIHKSFFKSDYKPKKGLLLSTSKQISMDINLNKYETYLLINKVEELSNYLPPTEKVENYSQLINFARKYNKVILRPLDISISKAIYYVEEVDNDIKITENTKSQSEKFLINSENDLKSFLQLNNVLLNNYFIQRCIKLVRVGELSYDIRVSMERKGLMEWKCHRIQCKVGKNKLLLNKISNNTRDIFVKKALEKSFPVGYKYDEAIKQINLICKKACKILQQNNPYLYQCEFDIAIDKNKNIWIIDINVLSSFKGFKQIDYTTYFSKEYAPILYAAPINSFKGL